MNEKRKYFLYVNTFIQKHFEVMILLFIWQRRGVMYMWLRAFRIIQMVSFFLDMDYLRNDMK